MCDTYEASIQSVATTVPQSMAVTRGCSYTSSKMSRSSRRNSIPRCPFLARGGCARRGWHPVAHPARLSMGRASGSARAFSSGGFPIAWGSAARGQGRRATVLSRHPECAQRTEAEKHHQFRVGRGQLENEPQLSQEFHPALFSIRGRDGCARRGASPAAHPARLSMGQASSRPRNVSSGGFPQAERRLS